MLRPAGLDGALKAFHRESQVPGAEARANRLRNVLRVDAPLGLPREPPREHPAERLEQARGLHRALPRLHLFELMDQPWWPAPLRDFSTDYLHTISERMDIFEGAVSVLARGLAAAESQTVVDLCSGGTGPLPGLLRRLAAEYELEPRVVLTDLYPNEQARQKALRHGERVEYLERPVDAMYVPEELKGLRTLFNAFHHFRPEQARAVLADAQAKGAPIAVFEILERTPVGLLATLLMPLLVLGYAPQVRPRRVGRLALTYLVPLNPLAVAWDGLVSTLRMYRPEELREMTAALAREGYTWEVGRLCQPGKPGKPVVTYVLGLPMKQCARQA
ncbi:MAG TPA: class I SAM-dependent methyltransferase [Myxococcaceae bacterium]|nr:class I SAM-dependent methyltransferase [Myxococcaceae bacterium]